MVTIEEKQRQILVLRTRIMNLALYKDIGDKNSLNIELENLRTQLGVFASVDAVKSAELLASLPDPIA